MDWIEVSLTIPAAQTDIVTHILERYGYQGVSVEAAGEMPEMYADEPPPPAEHYIARAYLPESGDLDTTRAEIEKALATMGLPLPGYKRVAEQDWAEAWKAHYKPLRVGQRIVIRPLWTETPIDLNDVEIALDPGMAFGTGTHETTQLCLSGLEKDIQPGMRVIDLGTGSGILAIAAAKLGASSVYAIDNDPVATEAARENAQINGVADKVHVYDGDLAVALASTQTFDYAVVNILARIIIQMCDAGLGTLMVPGGRAIFSGIIESQADDVEAALKRAGYTPTGREQLGEWVRIEARI